jgi:hypothetical protein
MASPGGRTSSVSVFTIDPFDVTLESGEELVHIYESILGLLAPVMPVVTFAGFVVVPKHTQAVDHIR